MGNDPSDDHDRKADTGHDPAPEGEGDHDTTPPAADTTSARSGVDPDAMQRQITDLALEVESQRLTQQIGDQIAGEQPADVRPGQDEYEVHVEPTAEGEQYVDGRGNAAARTGAAKSGANAEADATGAAGADESTAGYGREGASQDTAGERSARTDRCTSCGGVLAHAADAPADALAGRTWRIAGYEEQRNADGEYTDDIHAPRGGSLCPVCARQVIQWLTADSPGRLLTPPKRDR